MILAKKASQIFLLIFLGFAIASCEEGCVEIDEFDTESVRIESNPIVDGVYGFYEPIDGGQRADWHVTGLKSNGEQFIIQTSGSWTAWDANDTNDTSLGLLPVCTFCAKKAGVDNCICYEGQVPEPEEGPDGEPLTVDCSDPDNEDDPDKCTCTTGHGSALDYPVYHIPLNYAEKNETPKIADKQTNCRYKKGMGAYVGLFGSRGADVPLRAYHLYSPEEACNIVRDSNGDCIASNGQDVTRYVFRSANNRIFVKNDKAGNDGTDNNSSDDEYHKPNEDVKFIIYDRYYSDNYGGYNLTILKGVGDGRDTGLIEFLVRLVEDVLLGETNENGVRDGGIIEFMYKALVQDSGFIVVLQIALSLYIAFFGIAHLFGLAEMNKKELLSRVLKIGLVVFFTSKDSWQFYNDIVVGFFKDSMDYVVSVIMDMSDSNIDESSMIKIAQLDRASDVSNATRFSYVDLTIKKLFASGTSKKIWGLFFGTGFGILYIPIIYMLIAFFVYVMLYVATVYLINLIKLIFVLSLGPIFIPFSLFSKTQQMFKNWIGYLGGRSLEIVMLFLILYNFLMLIDKNFTDMLSYRTCLEKWGIVTMQIKILKSYPDRSFVSWIVSFVNIAGLLFIMQLIINQVPTVVGSLISIGSVKGGDYDSDKKTGGFLSSAGIMKTGYGLFKDAVSTGFKVAGTGARYIAKGAGGALRDSWLGNKLNQISEAIPVRGIRTRLRDNVIDAKIEKYTKEANAKGLTGAAKDSYIRGEAFKSLSRDIMQDPNKLGLYGLDSNSILKRFDQKLVRDPLKAFIKQEIEDQKSGKKGDVPLGYDAMKAAVEKAALEWGKKNLAGGENAVRSQLKAGFKDYLNRKSDFFGNDLIGQNFELTSGEAARLFAGNEKAQNRYLDYLRENEIKNQMEGKQAGIWRDGTTNPHEARENFLRKVKNRQNNVSSWASLTGDIQKYQNSRNERRALEMEMIRAEGERKAAIQARIREEEERMNALAEKDKSNFIAQQRKIDEEKDRASLDHRRYELEQQALKIAEANKRIEEHDQAMAKILAAGDGKQAGLVATQFEVQFGASVNDALLKSPDVGLKSGNVLLGLDDKSKKDAHEAEIRELEVTSMQEQAKLKMAKMNKKLKEFEIDQAKHDPKADVASLKRQLDDLEDQVNRAESRISSIDQQKTNLETPK